MYSDTHVSVVMVVIVGDGAVGKSAITIQLTQKTFINTYDPTIENAYRQSLTVDGKLYVLDILDTAGQEEYSAMRDHYFRKGHGFLIVYSVVNRQSFQSLEGYRRHILRVKESTSEDGYPMVFVANKVDLAEKRDVTAEEGQNLAAREGVPYIETSAKTGLNVEECFCCIVREINRHNGREAAAAAGASSKPDDDKKGDRKKSKCTLI